MLAADWTFAIWGPIYLAFLGYAVYQLLPASDAQVHRETGWWLVASAVFNTAGSSRSGPGSCRWPSW